MMSKRYYLCDIIGDGTEENPFRPAVADHAVDWAGSIPVGPDGKPTSTWALVIVGTKDHSILRGDNRIDPLPDFPLDGKVNSVNAAAKTSMERAIARRGIPAGAISGADGYRDVLRGIGAVNDPGFSVDRFDVIESR